jgi:hypothetical protein
MKVNDAVAIISSCTSARDAIDKLGLPRCRLHKLLASRAFREEMENYRQITNTIVTARAGQYAGWMMGNLANLTNGDNEDSARKACMAALAQAVDGKIRHANGGRPPKSLLQNITEQMLKLASNPQNTTDLPPAPEQKMTNNDRNIQPQLT